MLIMWLAGNEAVIKSHVRENGTGSKHGKLLLKSFEVSQTMRALSELIDDEEPAWPLVQSWIREASVPVEVLPVEGTAGDVALLATQVTTRSPMGAVVRHAAGLLIDHSWLRVLGAGRHPRFQRSLPEWNAARSDGFYLIADDAVGGFFAINGGALGDDVGNIYFYAPDSLRWEPCGFGYSQFLIWAMSNKLNEFYESLRWEQWLDEVKLVTGDQSIDFYPFLWAKGPLLSQRHRGLVPVGDKWSLQLELQKQLDGS